MEYRIISSFSIEEMQKEINSLLLQGWKLQGGICVYERGFAQAVVKDK